MINSSVHNSNNNNNGRKKFNKSSNFESVNYNSNNYIEVSGIVDIFRYNYGFIRTEGYLPNDKDVYIALDQLQRWKIRKGDRLVGIVNKEYLSDSSKRYNNLLDIVSINGIKIANFDFDRKDFGALTPLYSTEKLFTGDVDGVSLSMRIADIIAPIGKGQRGVIVAPPKTGKTTLLKEIANVIIQQNKDVKVLALLIDERPEEVTDMMNIKGCEIVASTFDQAVDNHIATTELIFEHAKRMVEAGKDVVILLDSLTRLSRAYNYLSPSSGRVLSGGLEFTALYQPKKIFGAARNIQGAGSLTCIATALVENNSRMDELIFEEFKGTGNMELKLDRRLSDRRIFPAIDVLSSSTRREDLFLDKNRLATIYKLRNMLGAMDYQQSLELLINKLSITKNNKQFFDNIDDNLSKQNKYKY